LAARRGGAPARQSTRTTTHRSRSVTPMRTNPLVIAAVTLASLACAPLTRAADDDALNHGEPRRLKLRPRPFYLVYGLDAGSLKDRLSQCMDGPFRSNDFSI